MPLSVCRLLYWEHETGEVPAVKEHEHGYFQIELCIHGEIRLRSGDDRTVLNAGDWVLLPPGTPHRMEYSGSDLEYYSLKFQVDHLDAPPPRALPVPHDALSAWCILNLRAQHEPGAGGCQAVASNRPILEGLLLILLQYALAPRAEANREAPGLRAALRALVAAEGARVSVKYAALKLNRSTSRLQYQYRLARSEADPEERCSLKQFLDRELQARIDRCLFYSDLPLTRVAAELHFNNVYTFSRFCRRMTGMPPSARRARGAAAGDGTNQSARPS